MKMTKQILGILLALVLILSSTVSSYAASTPVTYWDTYMDELNDEEDLIHSIKEFNINQITRLIFKVSDIDRFIFINGNIDLDNIWNMDQIFILNPQVYGYDTMGEKESEFYKDYLEYNIFYTQTSIESLNDQVPDLNLFIYSLGKNYYKYNYAWKDINVEIDKLNKKILKYNKTYGHNYNTLPYVNGIYSTYSEFHNDKELQERWESIERRFQCYYDEPIYPQDVMKGDD